MSPITFDNITIQKRLQFFCFTLATTILLSANISTSFFTATSPRHHPLPSLVSQKNRIPPRILSTARGRTTFLHSESVDGTILDEEEEEEDVEAIAAPSKVDNILSDIHSQGFRHRIVVIGNGAILETTSTLGPDFKSSVSPKTGEKLVTFSSEDKSFEFHLKVGQVGTIKLKEKDRPVGEDGIKSKMRIMRFLNKEGSPMCSLIMAEDSKEAKEWFTNMTIRYGYEVQV